MHRQYLTIDLRTSPTSLAIQVEHKTDWKAYPQLVCILMDEGAFFVVGPSVFPQILNFCYERLPGWKFVVRNRLLDIFQSGWMRDLFVVVGIVSPGRLFVKLKCYLNVRIAVKGKLLQATNRLKHFWQHTLDLEAQSFLPQF